MLLYLCFLYIIPVWIPDTSLKHVSQRFSLTSAILILKTNEMCVCISSFELIVLLQQEW